MEIPPRFTNNRRLFQIAVQLVQSARIAPRLPPKANTAMQNSVIDNFSKGLEHEETLGQKTGSAGRFCCLISH